MKLKYSKDTQSILILFFVFFSFIGCTGGGNATKKVSSPCGAITAGEFCKTIQVNDIDRSYLVHKPETATGNSPIIIFLHGAPGTINTVNRFFNARELANKYASIAVFPVGIGAWAWSSRVKDTSNTLSDDSQFISSLIDQLINEEQIDPGRVFIAGFSAGGFMGYQLACEIPDKITAIVNVSGQLRGDLDACHSNYPIAIHHIHGTADIDVPLQGRQDSITSVEQTMSLWQNINQCQDDSALSNAFTITTNNKLAITETYLQCLRPLELTLVTGGVHEENYDFDIFHQLIIDFFNRSIYE